MTELLLIALAYLYPCDQVVLTLEQARAYSVQDVYAEPLASDISERCGLE